MLKGGARSYRRTEVMTADPMRLVLICYEGAIDQLKVGKEKLRERDYEGKGAALTRARDIITELLGALDFEKGGSVATGLDALYKYILRRITEADMKKDLRPLDEAIQILSSLKEAWEGIFCGEEGNMGPRRAELPGGKGEARGTLSV